MNHKEEILKVLNRLSERGIDRARIEADFEYADNYIDQVLSRGGNNKFLAAIRIYEKAVLHNTTPPEPTEKIIRNVNLETIQTGLDKVYRLQQATLANVRAFGEYHVMKDAKYESGLRDEIMEQINRLVGVNLGAIAKEGTSADGGR